MDDNSNIYNTEMQKGWRGDLIKRTRYYQALIDSSLLAPGEIDFNSIKNTTIIMIMPFDLFGLGKYIYTFESVCNEHPELKLEDGAKRIFINTHGTNASEVSPEFIALMKFIEYNEDEENNNIMVSSNLEKIKARVAVVKASEEVGVKYMQKWEEEALIRHEALEQGREEKLVECIKSLMNKLGISAEEAMSNLDVANSDFEKYLKMM